MKNSPLILKYLSLAALAFAAVSAPSEAQAEIRLAGLLGLQRISGGGAQSTAFAARAEGTFSLIPWLHGGAYLQALAAGGDSRPGFGAGALVAFRPSFPLPFDPYGYASLGFQRAPTGVNFESGFTAEAGLGVAINLTRLIDLEARGGYVGLFGGQSLQGFSASLGLSLRL